MFIIGLQILFNWIAMGIIIAGAMIGCLYFAILCEKISDHLFSN